MARVVVVGSANMDLVATTPTLPRPGETVLGRGFATVPGGKGANQAIAAARAGASCAFIGAVGDDTFGAALRDGLRSSDVDISGLRTVDGPTGVALIAVDDAGENLIVVAPGANGALDSLTDADRVAVAAADVLLCQLEIPLSAVAHAAETARAGGTTVILNAAPARPVPPDLLAAVDLLVVNAVEAEAVGSFPRVVVTRGPAGATYTDHTGGRVDAPAPRIVAVDTTGAGDAFAGALAVAWAERRPVAEALRWACAAGAACARRLGASTALPTRVEIDALYKESY